VIVDDTVGEGGDAGGEGGGEGGEGGVYMQMHRMDEEHEPELRRLKTQTLP
jgi:hypothetical protein